MEEMRTEREDELLSRADSLATQMASLHYQKAERRTRVLETSQAVLTLHGLLMEELRESKSLKRQDMAHIIGGHCSVGGAATPSPSCTSRENLEHSVTLHSCSRPWKKQKSRFRRSGRRSWTAWRGVGLQPSQIWQSSLTAARRERRRRNCWRCSRSVG